MVLKVDSSKAYDSVERGFLEKVMTKLGFCQKWIELVSHCITTVSCSVPWRGQALGNFTPT